MDPNAGKSTPTSTYVAAGAGLIAIAVVAFLIFGKGGDDATCGLTTAGVAAISEGLTRGHSTSSIMTKGALAATVPSACSSVVAKLGEEPAAETHFKLETAAGEIDQSTSGSELTEAAPEPSSPTGSSRVVDCFLSYSESEFLDRLCIDEAIEP